MKKETKKLKVLKKADQVYIVFGEWFDKTYGNTDYDAEVYINGKVSTLKRKYGYNAGDKQSIDEALATCGYRVRKTRHYWNTYKNIDITVIKKLKRELYKETTIEG